MLKLFSIIHKQTKNILLIWLGLYFAPSNTYGQMTGKITDTGGISLPYATVYIEGTSTGTISNAEGDYQLDIPKPGRYTISFQYVGYKKLSYNIDYQNEVIVRDVIMETDDNILNEMTITANREDPAYAIIRKAIQKRTYYKNQVKSYEADLYVKGVVKLTDAPKKILGESIGDLNGILDSMRQGIIYLSESKSKFYYLHPGKTKEVMISSVKSGDNSLFTANQFSWASFDLNSEYLNFSRSIVSPIADVALAHYKYSLEKVIIDQNGYTVNKIKIIPKFATSPLLNGYIYITDDLWNIYSTDLKLYGTALKNTYLDTINIKQVFVPVAKPDTWRLFSQVFSFKAGLLGFKMGGHFSYIFSEYNLGADVSSHFENNETFKVAANALNRDSAFWTNVRPIPLTAEEQRDYIKKDSLQKLWNSDTYKDSLDRKNNKFSALKLLTGYTRVNSFNNTSLSFPSPLSTLRFNAVEGFKINLNTQWEKEDSTYRKWTLHPVLEYGFSDKIFKPRISAEYRFDNYNQGTIRFKMGRVNQQFEPREPITERNNTWTSLWNKVNNIRLYQNNYISLGFAKEMFNGFYLDAATAVMSRNPVYVNTQYSFRKSECLYEENIPRPDLDPSVYLSNKYWKNVISLLIRPAQKFASYPNVKIRDVSDWPNITTEYEVGIPLSSSSSFFQKVTMRIRDKYVNARLLGYFSYNIEGGIKFGKGQLYFGDFFHPMGNQLRSPIDPDLSSFNLLPYYEYSTDRHYIQINFRHHFNGFLFDMVPLLNKTSFKLVMGLSALYEPYKGRYIEPVVGIENFRLGPFQLFDIDYTWAFDKNGYRDRGFTFRLSQLLNN